MRDIQDTVHQDAMGCYPLFTCLDWSKLADDMESLRNSLVSIYMVIDPFAEYSVAELKKSFPDIVLPFKNHYEVDLFKNPKDFMSQHHMRNTRKAKQRVAVDVVDPKCEWLEDWVHLYKKLILKHSIAGIPAFSYNAFKKQSSVPGLTVFKATIEQQLVGMLLWYTHNSVAYYHLGAYSELGYSSYASFALFDVAIEYFASTGTRWLNLGSGAGLEKRQDGLSRFKAGWSSGTRTAYFCGRVHNRAIYDELVQSGDNKTGGYFPAYRW